jgi:hypothetical protein
VITLAVAALCGAVTAGALAHSKERANHQNDKARDDSNRYFFAPAFPPWLGNCVADDCRGRDRELHVNVSTIRDNYRVAVKDDFDFRFLSHGGSPRVCFGGEYPFKHGPKSAFGIGERSQHSNGISGWTVEIEIRV